MTTRPCPKMVDPGDAGRVCASYRVGMRATTSPRRESTERRRRGENARRRVLAGVPLTQRRLQAAGVSTVVLEGGASGPPLVLLHGGIECGGAYWARVIPRLAEAHRLVVPDVPGLGDSDPVGRLDGAAFAEWLQALLELTCEEPPALLAHSLLGSLAARYAGDEHDRLRRLVLYGAPGVGDYRLPPGLMVAAIRFSLRPSQRNQERFERWAFLDSALTKRQAPEWFEAFDAYCVSCGRIPHVKRAMRQLIRAGTARVPDGALARIESPTALLWGRHDRMVPLALAEDASARLGWPLHVVDGAGHVPHLEQPDAFLHALSRTLVTAAPTAQGRTP
jgi:2-hydroxymuconate-semialdehyde hydrolase